MVSSAVFRFSRVSLVRFHIIRFYILRKLLGLILLLCGKLFSVVYVVDPLTEIQYLSIGNMIIWCILRRVRWSAPHFVWNRLSIMLSFFVALVFKSLICSFRSLNIIPKIQRLIQILSYLYIPTR
jgi:hypothetical protein